MGSFWRVIVGLALICFGVGAIMGIDVWQYFFPLVVILVGARILLGHSHHCSSSHHMHGVISESDENTLDYSVTFNELNKKVNATAFQGGKISVTFGGGTVDLRDAKIAKNGTAHLKVDAVFGGIKILVPETWSVQGNLSGVFGRFDNATSLPDKPEGTLMVQGSAVFGGGEITN